MEVEEVTVPLVGVSESLSRLLEPLLVHTKQEWQQDSAKEVSPFTKVSWLQWGQQIMQTDTHALIMFAHVNVNNTLAHSSTFKSQFIMLKALVLWINMCKLIYVSHYQLNIVCLYSFLYFSFAFQDIVKCYFWNVSESVNLQLSCLTLFLLLFFLGQQWSSFLPESGLKTYFHISVAGKKKKL